MRRRRVALVAVFAISGLASYGTVRALSDAPSGTVRPAAPSGDRGTPAPPPRARLHLAAAPPAPVVLNTDPAAIEGELGSGDSLARVLSDRGVPAAIAHALSRGLRPVFDFRSSQVGDRYSLVLGADGGIDRFDYRHGRDALYRLERAPDGELHATAAAVELQSRTVPMYGVVESSLFDSVVGSGERAELAQTFVDLFVWDFDFSRQSRPGDAFRLSVEKLYDDDGFVRYGPILAAEYLSQDKHFTALYFEDADGHADYYTPDGRSVRRSFLRAPLNYRRISSRYTKSRLHPILKRHLPHEGIDYAAPTGTPVWAVADGVVIYKGWKGGMGRMVKLRHNNGYVTLYGHLSRYGKNLKVGQRVAQKRVIGYVGSSGLSTGPHLDYRIRVDGRYVDPQRVTFPEGSPIADGERDRFDRLRDMRLGELRAATRPILTEAAM